MLAAPVRDAPAGAADPLVEVDGVSVLYPVKGRRPSWALRDVSLSIGPQDFVCAVGPSGCGKTTLLYLIAGFIKPTIGAIKLNDRLIHGPGPDRGVVFQEYALFPWLTVRDNVEFGPRTRGVPADERARLVAEYLELINLTRAGDQYPFELSGGMRQRVAFARALVNKPRLLLMDEPFAAVDAMTRSSLQQELVKLWQHEQCASFFITHSVDEAVYLGTKVVVMSPHPGRVDSVIDIDLAYPRDRNTMPYRELIRTVQGALASHG
jgi:NitT/TauT family transport system ATP-binding protein